MPDNIFDMSNPPPKGNSNVGKYAYDLYLAAKEAKDNWYLTDKWNDDFALYQSDQKYKFRVTKDLVTINLIFPVIARYMADLTATDPNVEVRCKSGVAFKYQAPDAEFHRTVKHKLSDISKDDSRNKKLSSVIFNMMVYSPGIVKYTTPQVKGKIANPEYKNGEYTEDSNIAPNLRVLSPYELFPCPGMWDDLSKDIPYICHKSRMNISVVEDIYGVSGLVGEDEGDELGKARDGFVSTNQLASYGSDNTTINKSVYFVDDEIDVIECWIRDWTREDLIIAEEIETFNEETQEVTIEIKEKKIKGKGKFKYPGGIRKITICNLGETVLDDVANPNINAKIYETNPEMVESSYLFNRFPFHMEVAQMDNHSIWGFSMVDQIGPLNFFFNKIITEKYRHTLRAMKPPFVINGGSNINKSDITNKPMTVLKPADDGKGLRFIPVPSLNRDYSEFIAIISSYIDDISSVQDVDKGKAPGSIRSGTAIVALKTQNQIIRQAAIKAIERIIEVYTQWDINYLQNFSWANEILNVDDELKPFCGQAMLQGMEFDVAVEPESTLYKPKYVEQEIAIRLAESGITDAIDVLDKLNWPNKDRIIERKAEDQLGVIRQIMVEAAGNDPNIVPYIDQVLALLQQNQTEQLASGPQYTPLQQATPGVPKANPNAGKPPMEVTDASV